MGQGVNSLFLETGKKQLGLREFGERSVEMESVCLEIEQLRSATVRELRTKYLQLFGEPSGSNHKQYRSMANCQIGRNVGAFEALVTLPACATS
jgi:hypothetical protein